MRVGLCALQGFFLADVSGPYVGVRYEETLVGSVSVDCFAFAVAEGIVISGVSYAKTSLVGYIFAESQTAVGMGVACYDVESNCATRPSASLLKASASASVHQLAKLPFLSNWRP